MFIQTEDTPNPASMKFLPGRDVTGESGPVDIGSPDAAGVSPLAANLFAIDGVVRVFLGRDFVTVTKAEGQDWPTLRPHVLTVLMEHFVAGRPVLSEQGDTGSAPAETGADSDVVRQIRSLLDTKIRPAVAQDGGDITFERFDEGVVWLHLKGSCAGCPSSTATLKAGVESMLKHYVPEVKEVRQTR